MRAGVMAERGASFDGLAHAFALAFRGGYNPGSAAAARAAGRFGSLAIAFGFLLDFLTLFRFFPVQFNDRLLENFGRNLLALLARFSRGFLKLRVTVRAFGLESLRLAL